MADAPIRHFHIDLDAAPGAATPLHDGDRLHFGDLRCQVSLSTASEVTSR